MVQAAQSRNERKELNVLMWRYVPYGYAVFEFKRLDAESQARARWELAADTSRKAKQEDRGRCPVCGYHVYERGFVRLPFPVGHRLFGKAICCPACWPAPFGNNQDDTLADTLEEVAEAWRTVLERVGCER